jgi:hypothetical protein
VIGDTTLYFLPSGDGGSERGAVGALAFTARMNEMVTMYAVAIDIIHILGSHRLSYRIFHVPSTLVNTIYSMNPRPHRNPVIFLHPYWSGSSPLCP